jgi:hypothetical protein
MTDSKDNNPDKKSIPNLKTLPGKFHNHAPAAQEKRKSKDCHYNIAKSMAGEKWGWHDFPVKLHCWQDHMGVRIPYEETAGGIVRKIADDRLHYLIAKYWRDVLITGENPIVLGTLTAKDLRATRDLWLGIAKARKDKFLTLGWKSETRPAHHKVAFDPTPGPFPLFKELMDRTSNAETFKAWVGSLFDEKSQRQQYAWLYGTGGNGKSAMVRVLMNALGPVAAFENPPTRDAKHWTVGLSNKRLVVFPDCNNVGFVTSGEFKQLTGEDPVRMEPKGKAVYYETLDAKFLIISNDRPRISSAKADMRRVLFFSVAELSDANKVDRYEERLAAEAPAFLSACWQAYLDTTGGNPRHEFVVADAAEIKSVAEDTEHEHEAFALGSIDLIEYPSTTPHNARKFIEASIMLEIMTKAGFKSEYERRKLREYLERKCGIIRTKVKTDGKMRLVYLNCKKLPL